MKVEDTYVISGVFLETGVCADEVLHKIEAAITHVAGTYGIDHKDISLIYDGEDDTEVSLVFKREETEKETAKRLKAEEALKVRKQREKKVREQNERKQYEKLKAKFEG